MNHWTLNRSLAAFAALALLGGCATMPQKAERPTTPERPYVGESLALDQLVVIVDVTGSMSGPHYVDERQLLGAFTGSMPDGPYEAGINSFSGVSEEDWVRCEVAPYDRVRFESCEDEIELLGSLTPLDRAIRLATPEMEGKGGNGALLVFSDGIVQSQDAVVEACRAMQEAHGGKLCVYTVQIGTDAEGGKVLEAMAASTGCGKKWSYAGLKSNAALKDMVHTVFFRGVTQHVLPGDVLFDFDKDVLKPAGKVEVDRVVALLKMHPNRDIVVAGHTCDLGSEAYNLDLSQRRADSVRAYAITQGINAERISTEAYGESMPAVPNTDESNRSLNRRVTFTQ